MTRSESPLAVPAGVSTGESYSSSSPVRSTYPAQRAPEEVIMAEVNFAEVLVSAHCWNSARYRTFSQLSL